MKTAEEYVKAAERELARSENEDYGVGAQAVHVGIAQVYATLAQAAATADVFHLLNNSDYVRGHHEASVTSLAGRLIEGIDY
ncbi:MAG TPA: hypothetical protein VHB02_06260 [Acidimicrobiales bacterium]|nr:hypothetical protein [Acidimicrobiales bacterium]